MRHMALEQSRRPETSKAHGPRGQGESGCSDGHSEVGFSRATE